MVAEKLSFRRYRNEDFEEYAGLYLTVYNKEIDRDFFIWKHNQNPALEGPPLIYLAIGAEGQIVGANSFFPSQLTYQEKEYQAVQSGDTMVHPNFRGQGIFMKILKFAVEDLQKSGQALVYGYANGNSYPGFVKFGFSDLGRINVYYRILNWSHFLESKGFAGKLLGGLVDTGFKLFQVLDLRKNHSYEITPLSLNASEIQKMRLTLNSDRILPVKDPAYLTWKYENKPGAVYRTLGIKQQGHLVGLAVIREEGQGNQKRGEILEFISTESIPAGTDPSHSKGIPNGQRRSDEGVMLKQILGTLKEQGFTFVRIWEPTDQARRKALTKNFFVQRQVELYFITKILQEELSFFNTRELWEVIGGNADTA